MVNFCRSVFAIVIWVVLPAGSLNVVTAEDFQQIAGGFLAKYCVSCHSEKEANGDLQVGDLVESNFRPADAHRWLEILEMINVGDMPPAKAKQPAAVERKAFITALTGKLNEHSIAQNEWEKRLPRYANRVDHESLFSGEHQGPAYTPSRVWRINGSIYFQLMQDLQLGSDFVVPLQKNETGFHDYSLLVADEATIRTMMQNAKRAATAMIKGRHIKPRGAAEKDPKNKGRYEGGKHKVINEFVAIQGEPTTEQLSGVAAFVLEFLTRRKPTSDEIAKSVNEMLLPNIRVGGNEAGLHGYIVAVLVTPEFLFRSEVGRGKKLPDGRRMLSPSELAFALSYTLYDHPVESLLKAAEEGRLQTREDVEREFRAMLNDPKVTRGRVAVGSVNRVWQASKPYDIPAKPRLLRFFQEYFEYTKATEVFKDDTRHGGLHDPKSLIKDANWTVLSILAEDKNVLEELLTTDQFAVPAGKTPKKKPPGETAKPRMEAYLAAYNLTEAPTQGRGFGLTEMPKGQRAGMLTHPAWLVAHSQNFHTDPVRRGKWILGHLLGYDVPELPIAVQAQLPEEPHETIRHRFRVVREERCWRCHKKMNPLGEVFEAYDDFGRFRTHHLMDSNGDIVETQFEKNYRRSPDHIKNAEPKIEVDTTGELFGLGDPELNGPVKDPVELMNRLAKSKRVRQVFIRHVFRYWMGRNEMLSDSPTLIAMDNAYVESGGSFQEILVALVTSDSFLTRK